MLNPVKSPNEYVETCPESPEPLSALCAEAKVIFKANDYPNISGNDSNDSGSLHEIVPPILGKFGAVRLIHTFL